MAAYSLTACYERTGCVWEQVSMLPVGHRTVRLFLRRFELYIIFL